MLLGDPYAGHRKWWDPDWVEDPAIAMIWTEWDYLLMRTYQYLEDFTSPNGHLAWVEEDPDVGWDIDVVESGFEKAMHDYRENNDVKDWQNLRARPVWEDDVEPPSMEKWLKRAEENASGGFPSMPQGGTPRPPTAEELAALRNPEQNA